MARRERLLNQCRQRYLSGEPEAVLRRGFAQLFAKFGVAIDADDSVALMIFPEMDATVDVPEITACWGILSKSPESVMCATSRMVVKHKGTVQPSVIACTFLPYEVQQTPLGRSGQPTDIAPAVVFLASDDARWVTGEMLVVSSGM